jgi:uncharacterized protein
MPIMHILVVGGTGMIGRNLVDRLLGEGHEVTITSRSRDPKGLPEEVHKIQWDTKSPFAHDGPFDAVVSVVGASLIDKRWTPAYKEELRRSRIEVNRYLREWIQEAQPPPKVFVSSSAVGIYGRSPATTVVEESPPGDDFLARLCVDWERETMKAESDATRAVVMRQGVVIDRQGDAVKKMLPFFKMGLGGPVGSGRQPVPWISSHDLVRMFLAALEDDRFTGPVNAVSPADDTNRDLTKALGKVLNRPTVFPVPPIMLQALYGEAAMVMTEGQSVLPQAAKKAGFTWDHASLEVALRWALEEDAGESPSRRESEMTRSA